MRDSKPVVETTLNSEKMRQEESCFTFLFLNYMQNLPNALLMLCHSSVIKHPKHTNP